jgi:transposase InsO family protein
MNRAGVRIGVGARFCYEGEIVEIVEMHVTGSVLEAVAKDRRGETVRRFSLEELLVSERARLIGPGEGRAAEDEPDVASVVLSAVPEAQRRLALERAAHVREVLTGFRSGFPETALPGEPRQPYTQDVPIMERYAAKAGELNVDTRTIERWVAQYRANGEAGLVPQRAVRSGFGSRMDPRWAETALEIMYEYTDLSTPTKDLVIRRTQARLDVRFGPGVVKMPSQRTAYRILDDLEHQRHALFEKSTKRNRDIAGRPKESYGKLRPTRPGEYMLMDTTRLDVYAMDPNTLCWVNAELTVAMDWYSRCITGLRLTPVSTKSIDAAAVLYQSFRPPPAGRDWPAKAVWPPHGIPRSVLVDEETLDLDSVIAAASPAIVPETLIVDHGKIYVGAHLNSVCQRLGISIQPARLRTGRDKGPVERFFLTLREGLLQELPGYKGADVYSRGVAPEKEAWFFLDELEVLIREWIAVVYHHSSHGSLTGLGLPGLHMSPAEKFAQGVARAGYLEAPRDPDLAFEFLPVVWRTIQPYGVEWNGRTYRGEVIGGRGGHKSPYLNKNKKWPIHVNPDDITRVFFRDPRTRRWHPLVWEHAEMLNAPMSEEVLAFERHLAKADHRYVDDPLAITNFLERRKLSLGTTMAERRMALRISREQSSLIGDITAVLGASDLPALRAARDRASGERAPEETDSDLLPNEGAANAFVDDLDEEPDQRPLVDAAFYDDVLEVL